MATQTCGLLEHVQNLRDPRRANRNLKHTLPDLLVLALSAIVAGCDDFVEIASWSAFHADFFRPFLALTNGTPSHDTFNRVFTLLRPDALQKVLLPWLAQRLGLPGDFVHSDGKVMRRTRCKTKDLGALTVVSAWASQQGLTLGQVAVEDKSNEITAIPLLLAILDLRDKVVTIDAAGCQTEIATAILEGGGDYVLAVKGNQPTLHEEVQAVFAAVDEAVDAGQPLPRGRETGAVEEGHGRVEIRRVEVVVATRLRPELRQRWPGLRSLVRVVRLVEEKATGKVTREESYYISSLAPKAERLAAAIRGHWMIENGLHWVLDVVFREDGRRLFDHTAADNVAHLHRLALSLLRGERGKESLKGKRKRAGWDIRFVAKLLALPTT